MGRDHQILRWDVRQWKVLEAISHPDYRTVCNWSKCALRKDGQVMIAGSATGQVFGWEFDDTPEATPLPSPSLQHPCAIVCAEYSHDVRSPHLATADKNGYLYLWTTSQE